jgi:hypothetical protein
MGNINCGESRLTRIETETSQVYPYIFLYQSWSRARLTGDCLDNSGPEPLLYFRKMNFNMIKYKKWGPPPLLAAVLGA